MTEIDDLLGKLGTLEREYDETFPHAWEDVVRGTKTAEQVRREREGIDDPEELDALAAQIQPRSDADREVWIDRLAGMLDRGDAGDGKEPGGDDELSGDQRHRHQLDQGELDHARPHRDGDEHEDDAGSKPNEAVAGSRHADATPPSDQGSGVVSLDDRRRRRTTWVVTAVGLVAAAALMLWLVPPQQASTSTTPGVELPSFSLHVRNETVHAIRKDPAGDRELPRYQAQSRIDWLLRPQHKVSTALVLRVVAIPQDGTDGERRLIDPGPTTVSAYGVIGLRGTFGETIGLGQGRWSLRFVMGVSVPADLAALDAGGPWFTTEPHLLQVIP